MTKKEILAKFPRAVLPNNDVVYPKDAVGYDLVGNSLATWPLCNTYTCGVSFKEARFDSQITPESDGRCSIYENDVVEFDGTEGIVTYSTTTFKPIVTTRSGAAVDLLVALNQPDFEVVRHVPYGKEKTYWEEN
jgi:hypothetical protein